MIIPKRYRTAHVAESIAIGQYLLKAVLKIWIGGMVASSMIIGDGKHNLADIVPALIVLFSIWLRSRKAEGYPYQLREVEAWLTFAIGALLAYTAVVKIFWSSLLGVLSEFPAADQAIRNVLPLSHHEAVRIDGHLFWPLMALMGGSFIASLLTARFQIAVGKEMGETALVADGKETLSDGMVEAAGLIGAFLVQILHWRMAEYALGVVVSGLVFRTAVEIMKPSLDVVLKRSLGNEVERRVGDTIRGIPGVDDLGPTKSFKIGSTAVYVVRFTTNVSAERLASLRTAIYRRVEKILLCVEGVRDVDLHIVPKTLVVSSERVAYFACKMGEWRVVKSDEATHFLICDPMQGDPSTGRLKDYAIPFSPNAPREITIGALLITKHVRVLRVLCDDDASGVAGEVRSGGIKVEHAYFRNPFLDLGMKKPK